MLIVLQQFSEITNNECRELLDKSADVVLMNGFEDDFVPKGNTFVARRKKARQTMLNLANKLLGTNLTDETLIVGTSGRYEFKNKGINVYLESLNRLTRDMNLKRDVLAFINVPGWVGDPREDLIARLKSKEQFTTPLEVPFITHWLHNMNHDQVLDMLKYLKHVECTGNQRSRLSLCLAIWMETTVSGTCIIMT